MLRLDATSFREQYDPTKKGAPHYEMYGRPFGKSLCHAWGEDPIYLLGRYYLGEIRVKADAKGVTVTSDGGRGTLVFPDGRRLAIPPKTPVHAAKFVK